MKNSTLFLFGLLVVLLAISSADGLKSTLFRKSRSSKKEGTTKEVIEKGKQAEEKAKKEAEEAKKRKELEAKKKEEEEKRKLEKSKKKDSKGEKDLLDKANVNPSYKPYYEGSQVKDVSTHLTQHDGKKSSKGFDEAKARIIASEMNKKPQSYLESIGGGTGGSKEIEQKLVKQKIQKGLKYH